METIKKLGGKICVLENGKWNDEYFWVLWFSVGQKWLLMRFSAVLRVDLRLGKSLLNDF